MDGRIWMGSGFENAPRKSLEAIPPVRRTVVAAVGIPVAALVATCSFPDSAGTVSVIAGTASLVAWILAGVRLLSGGQRLSEAVFSDGTSNAGIVSRKA